MFIFVGFILLGGVKRKPEIRQCSQATADALADLPQVDLMNFRVEHVRPRSGRCLGREAAERATKSREVRRVLNKQDERLFRKSSFSVARKLCDLETFLCFFHQFARAFVSRARCLGL